MLLELGIISGRFVLMQKRMMFLYYTLKENTDSLTRKVVEALKLDSKQAPAELEEDDTPKSFLR